MYVCEKDSQRVSNEQIKSQREVKTKTESESKKRKRDEGRK